MKKRTEQKAYNTWSAEYMQEAALLKERVEQIRKEAQETKNSDEADKLSWRAAMLYSMYLDCLHTGQLLAERFSALSRKDGKRAEYIESKIGENPEFPCGKEGVA